MVPANGAALSEAKRWAIIDGWSRGLSKAAIARRQEVSRGAVDKWIQRHQASGGVGVAPRSGQKRKISGAAAQRAYDLLLDGAQRSANDVALELGKEGWTEGPVHRTTVVRAAKQLGKTIRQPIHSVSGPPAKQLTAATQAKRLKFALGNQDRSWGAVMFTDRKRFYHRYPGTAFRPTEWKRKGEKRSAFRPNNPSCLNIYVGITKFGATAPTVVAGTTKHKSTFTTKKGQPSRNITQSEYREVLNKHLLPQGTAIFKTHGITSWTFQQDNDPSHGQAKDVIAQWNAKKGSSIGILQNWPPNSPDLSPVENFWGWVQAKVDGIAYDTFDDFKAGVEKQIRNAPKELVSKYFKSMKGRVAKVKQLKGGKTKY
jgi:transposase